MQVKIAGRIYDAADQPIMVIFSEKEKANLRPLLEKEGPSRYGAAPITWTFGRLTAWMDAGQE